jgi:hypothetical protein
MQGLAFPKRNVKDAGTLIEKLPVLLLLVTACL